MAKARVPMVRLTDLLVLSVLANGECYAQQIITAVMSASGGRVKLGRSVVHYALRRLERGKLIEAHWQVAAAGQRRGERQHYRLTEQGLETLGGFSQLFAGLWAPHTPVRLKEAAGL